MERLKSLLTTLAALATIIGVTIAFMEFVGAPKNSDSSEGAINNNQQSNAISNAGPGGSSTAISNLNNSVIVNQSDNRIVGTGDGIVVGSGANVTIISPKSR